MPLTDPQAAFRSGRASAWTRERLERLGREEIENLRANAAERGEDELAALCAELLTARPGVDRAAKPREQGGSTLMPRSRAFQARGVWLSDPRTSWSGVRKSDGMVVMALWRGAVRSEDGGCVCLLWAPNVDGARPWSDTPAGIERREHCALAMKAAVNEGLLVHGEALEGRLPEDRARTVHGINMDSLVRFRVEARGGEYWAIWGRASRPSAA